MGRKIGYARVSTGGQEIGQDWQIDQLTRAGVKRSDIYSEHITGTKANRPELRNALRTLREGDQLVVAKLDRLARSLKDLLDLDAEIRTKGASLVLLDSNIDTATSSGRLFISIMGAAAEFEASLVSERTRAALATTRARGRQGGRKPALTPTQKRQAIQMYQENDRWTAAQIAGALHVSRATIYKTLNEAGAITRPQPVETPPASPAYGE